MRGAMLLVMVYFILILYAFSSCFSIHEPPLWFAAIEYPGPEGYETAALFRECKRRACAPERTVTRKTTFLHKHKKLRCTEPEDRSNGGFKTEVREEQVHSTLTRTKSTTGANQSDVNDEFGFTPRGCHRVVRLIMVLLAVLLAAGIFDSTKGYPGEGPVIPAPLVTDNEHDREWLGDAMDLQNLVIS